MVHISPGPKLRTELQVLRAQEKVNPLEFLQSPYANSPINGLPDMIQVLRG